MVARCVAGSPLLRGKASDRRMARGVKDSLGAAARPLAWIPSRLANAPGRPRMIAFAETLSVESPVAASPVSAATPRFTLDGDGQLERHLAQTCARVVSGIRGLVPAHLLE